MSLRVRYNIIIIVRGLLLLSIYLTGIQFWFTDRNATRVYTHEQAVTRRRGFSSFLFRVLIVRKIHLVSFIPQYISYVWIRYSEHKNINQINRVTTVLYAFRLRQRQFNAGISLRLVPTAQVFYGRHLPVCTHRNPLNPFFVCISDSVFANKYVNYILSKNFK